MPSPFPGMDPYIERPEIWPDFHDRLITHVCGAIQPSLRPKYAALMQDRLYVTQSGRPIYPDIGIIRTRRPKAKGNGGTAVLEADPPVVFPRADVEIREPYIEIIEPAAGHRVVTAIEVLSPSNKADSDGRASYLQKKEELLDAGVNFVEIDLLRDGEPTYELTNRQRDRLGPFHYLVAATRHSPAQDEMYPIPLQGRLPRVSIPLAAGDKDVTLDLQSVFVRCWEEGAYPELLHYEQPPPGTLTSSEITWCKSLLKPKRTK